MAPRAVLVLAGGAEWEPALLAAIETDPGLVLLKRCVDIEDVLAATGSGQAAVVVLALDAPGVDADAVDRIRRSGACPVGVGGSYREAGQERAASVGLPVLWAEHGPDEFARLGEVVQAAARVGSPPGVAPDPGVDGADGPAHAVDRGEGAQFGPPVSQAQRGRVVVVCGPSGAPGRSFLASALASELAARGHSVTLVDADLTGGSLALSWGILDEVSGLLAVGRMAVGGRVPQEWSTAARTVAPGLQVLSGLPSARRWRDVSGEVVGSLIDQAAQVGWVVLDVAAGALGQSESDPGVTLTALELADEIVVVGSAEPLGLLRLSAAVSDLRGSGLESFRVLVNRWRRTLAASEQEIAALVAESAGGVPIHLLPEDRGTADRVIRAQRGLAEVAPDSALHRAVARVVDDLVPAGTARAVRGTTRRRASRARRR